jgi:hypothetical protein
MMIRPQMDLETLDETLYPAL